MWPIVAWSMVALASLGSFLVLGKFCGLVTMSWLWVLSPYLASLGLFLMVGILVDIRCKAEFHRWRTLRVFQPL